MAVVKWDPLRDLLSIQDRMNRLFEQTLSRQQDKIRAVFRDGVLEIRLPKRAEATPRIISVETA